MNRSQRDAERCGRRAAQLLTDDDTVLLVPADGRALAATCAAAPDGLVMLGIGDPALLAMPGVRPLADTDAPTVVLIEALAIFDDGTCALPPAAATAIARARQHASPCYVLAPAGPQPQPAAADSTPADQVAAIITARGTYRPEMITRHHNDPDFSVDDIIPLG